MKIAYLASTVTLPNSPHRRSDAFEHDLMMSALKPAFWARGVVVQDVSWDDETIDWADYAAAIVGTTWDYWDRPGKFLKTLKKIETTTPLFNSAATVAWNMHKAYLKELETKGASLIPTLWIDNVTPELAAAAFDQFGTRDLVFKRQVGAGADGQHRVTHGDTIPDMPHAMMVQPFLSTIQTEGEMSFIFIDGLFSHALVKRAKPGDYRIQSTYGGYEEVIMPNKADQDAAQTILKMLDTMPLYARVDMIRADTGGLLLMELELIEPYLYPNEGPELGERMAAAVLRRLS